MGSMAGHAKKRLYDEVNAESPKQGIRFHRNSFKKRESNEQVPRHGSLGHEHGDKKRRTGVDDDDDVPKSCDSERTPPRVNSLSSAIATPNSISSKASSSAVLVDGGFRACTQSLFSRFSTQGSLESFGAITEEFAADNIKAITNPPTVKSGLETAAWIDILNLTQASTPVLENAADVARRGAMLMVEGQNKVNLGEEMLKLAFKEIRREFKLT